ncbi:MAG: hypothetical protein EXQ74_05365 [Thermoleophilia bacterium]|nr:hypothetical protein [Thermoleophilia bacterium]
MATRLMPWGVAEPDPLVATLLHDVVDSTATTPDGNRAEFGSRPVDPVVWLTLPKGRDADGAREHYRRLLE